MDPISFFINQALAVIEGLDKSQLNSAVEVLLAVRKGGGRLFILGSGGGAGHASHAVCDFRKIAGFEAYSPSDNVSELTARINDEGWETCYARWLKGSRVGSSDALLIFSVGGGDEKLKISANLVEALKFAKQAGARVVGVVGPAGGYTAQIADACIKIPVTAQQLTTPLTEAIQALVWHLLVSDPRLKIYETKWESVIK